jgi:hypothetical protein
MNATCRDRHGKGQLSVTWFAYYSNGRRRCGYAALGPHLRYARHRYDASGITARMGESEWEPRLEAVWESQADGEMDVPPGSSVLWAALCGPRSLASSVAAATQILAVSRHCNAIHGQQKESDASQRQDKEGQGRGRHTATGNGLGGRQGCALPAGVLANGEPLGAFSSILLFYSIASYPSRGVRFWSLDFALGLVVRGSMKVACIYQ